MLSAVLLLALPSLAFSPGLEVAQQAPERSALVVGLSYLNADRNVVAPLRSTVPQALRYGMTLDRAGFKTTVLTDGTLPVSVVGNSSLAKLSIVQGGGGRDDVLSRLVELPSDSIVVLVGHGGEFRFDSKSSIGFFGGDTRLTKERQLTGVVKLEDIQSALKGKGSLLVLDSCRDEYGLELLSSQVVQWQPSQSLPRAGSASDIDLTIFFAASTGQTAFAHPVMYENDLGFGTGGTFFGSVVCAAIDEVTVGSSNSDDFWKKIQRHYQRVAPRWIGLTTIPTPRISPENGNFSWNFPGRGVKLIEPRGVTKFDELIGQGLVLLPRRPFEMLPNELKHTVEIIRKTTDPKSFAYSRGEIQKALDLFDRAKSLDGKSALAISLSAYCKYLLNGLSPSIEAELVQAIDLAPNLAASHYYMALVRWQQSLKLVNVNPGGARLNIIKPDGPRAVEAERLLRRAVELDPRYAIAYLALGTFLGAVGGEVHLRRALELEPENSSVLLNVGEFLQRIGSKDEERATRISEAESLFRRAIRSEPNYPDSYQVLYELLMAQQRWQDIRELKKEADKRKITTKNWKLRG